MLMPRRTALRSISFRSVSIRKIPFYLSDNLRQSIPRFKFKSFFALVCLITTIFFFLNRSPPSTSSPSLPTTTTTTTVLNSTDNTPTNLSHILFSLASSTASFPRREPYLRLWYKPNITRVLVFVDRLPPSAENTTTDPPLVVSRNTDRFPYTFPRGFRSAIRVARVVKEAVERNEEEGVRWFVFGDDDTMFFPENLAAVLAGYDHQGWYYIGGRSESFEQNAKMSFDMAFGGAGFAISYPLARVLARVFDSCLMRYPHLYGSDARVSACLAELGVGLTFEPGFHQVDFRGSLFGLLTAHPLSPLLSLHHLELVDPIFPQLDRIQSLNHLLQPVQVDPYRILQQSVCYDRSNNLTLSVSWGYAIQVYKGNHLLLDLLPLQRTFKPWRRNAANTWFQYVIDTRDFPHDPCKRPAVFFLKRVVPRMKKVLTKYYQDFTHNCPPHDVIHHTDEIWVSTKKMDVYDGKVKTRRRQCCDILPPLRRSMRVEVRSCREEELITMNV